MFTLQCISIFFTCIRYFLSYFDLSRRAEYFFPPLLSKFTYIPPWHGSVKSWMNVNDTGCGRNYVLILDLHFAHPGASCKTWDVALPQSIVGIMNSCVVIPCSFSVPDNQEANILNCSDSGVWKRGSISGPNILNSRSPSTNVIKVSFFVCNHRQ